MRHVSHLASLIAAVWLHGCSSTRPYEQTAAMLSNTLYQWTPRSSDNSYTPAQVDQASAADFERCVADFSDRIARVRDQGYRGSSPSREARVLELLGCMETKGWVFKYNELLEEINVTSR